MKNSKYSIFFMKDDTHVRKFHISSFCLRFYVILQIMLITLTAGALYVGVTSLHDATSLKQEKLRLSRQLKDAELRLSTLGNMKKIFEAYDKHEIQNLLTTAPENGKNNELQKAVDLAAIFTPTDYGLIKVEELKASFVGSSLNINFKIENPKLNTVLSGCSDLAIVGTDGAIFPLKTKQSDLDFQIQRHKFVRTSVKLPKGVTKDNAFGLKISINRSDGKVIFSETYPLYHILI